MANTDPEDDDFELELEEVDPEVVELARKRVDRQVKETEARAAQLEVYEQRSDADPISIDDLKSFRFTTRHLLMATAVLAVIMAMVRVSNCNGLFFSALAALAFGWWYVLRKERHERLAKERRRLEAEARLAELRKSAQGEPIASTVRMEGLEPAEVEVLPERPPFTFSFSLRQMLWAFAVAAVVMALGSALGPQNASWLLGIIAVAGLAIQLMGFELPAIILFSWWILLVLYLLTSVYAILAPGAGP